MKIFNKKYHYILPLLCVASFSAQATYSEEQEISNRAGLLKAQQNEKFKDDLYTAIEGDSLLKQLKISLMYDEGTLEEWEERSMNFPNRPEYLKSVQNWRQIVQEKQTQINRRTAVLKREYEERCKSQSVSSFSSQTDGNIFNKRIKILDFDKQNNNTTTTTTSTHSKNLSYPLNYKSSIKNNNAHPSQTSKNIPDERFKADLYTFIEEDLLLKQLKMSLMYDEGSLEEWEERSINFPNHPEYLKSLQNWRKIVQERQTRINLRTDFLMKKYKEDCDSRQLSLTSSSSQTTEKIFENQAKMFKSQQNEKFEADPNERLVEKDKDFLNLKRELKYQEGTLKFYEKYLEGSPNNFKISNKKEECLASIKSIKKQMEEMNKNGLLALPIETLHHIVSYLSKEEDGSFRQASRFIKEKIFDEAYKSNLKKRFINSASTSLEDVLTDMPEIAVSPFKDYLLQAVCEDYLNKDGFLAVIQGSLLEGYLSRNYASIPFYNYLNNQQDYAKELFKVLFGKEIPEKKYELALNLLCGCLPSNHIYVKKGTRNTSPLLKEFNNTLLKSMKSNNKKYFLLGIDEDFSILEKEEHVIVINQSHQDQIFNLEYFPYSTVILNADQEVLNSPYSSLGSMKKLILVNGNNQCKRIGDKFLNDHRTLELCSPKGLGSVEKIQCDFLKDCKNLFSFYTKGLGNVSEIEKSFMSGCKRLHSFWGYGLNNLEKIGDDFLKDCKKLSIIDTGGLYNVQNIGNNFLKNCRKLFILYINGFVNVQNIGDSFLEGTIFSDLGIKEKLLKKKK